MPPPSNTTKDSSGIFNINMKKRDSKFGSKSTEKCFQNYIENKNCIAEITIKTYIHILQKIKSFSSKLEVADISSY